MSFIVILHLKNIASLTHTAGSADCSKMEKGLLYNPILPLPALFPRARSYIFLRIRILGYSHRMRNTAINSRMDRSNEVYS